MNCLHLHVCPKIELATSIPFKDRFFAAPHEGHVFVYVIVGDKATDSMKLDLIYEFVFNTFNLFRKNLNIDSYPLVAAHNSRSEITTMGNGKMISVISKKWFACVGNSYQLKWKIRKKIAQQIPAGQMLQSLVRMRNLFLQRNCL